MLIISSLALAVFAAGYAVITDYRLMLALAVVQGVFWSALLSASAAYMTNMLPERRRAEGIGYWGLSTMAAIAVSPIDWLLYLPPRLDLALRGRGRAEPGDGGDRVESRGASAGPCPPGRARACSSGGCS